ncbi:MAG: PAS domain-containing sensor histidine kinase [Candidatus Saccharibacteria bacterium]
MNKGDFKHKLDLPLNNELGDIARALDLAMEHISTSQQLLINEKAGVEKVVDQRTSELSEEKARFLASINSLPLGYILLDRQGNILLLNPKVRHILKLNPTIEHEVAQNNEGGEGNKIIDSVINNVQKMAAHQKHLDTQDITSANGRFLHVLASAIMDGNTIEGFVVLVEDVTEAKILERSRDEFFSIASHELRTPLTAIRGNASMIKDFYKEQLKTEGLDEMVNDIHTSSVRLLEIVNDFLDTSSLELGKMRFEPKDISIDKIIEDVVYEMGSISKQKKVHIVAGTVLGKLPPVFADPNRIKQVILNLVGNALKFTTEGSVTIIAEAQLKGMVKVSIVDTGRGISPEGQQLLFHKFQQAGKSLFTRDAAGGTGLGLYISKLIVEKQGGKISLERSEEGVGSTFSFTLPIAKVNSSSELADNETKLVAEAVATSSI